VKASTDSQIIPYDLYDLFEETFTFGVQNMLRPSSSERGFLFGLTWSALGCMIAVAGLSSCSYFIPDDERPPRYNTVLGPKRAPALNRAVGAQTPNENLSTPQQIQQLRRPSAQPNNRHAGAPASAGYSGGNAGVAQSTIGSAPSASKEAGFYERSKNFYKRSKNWIFGEDAGISEIPVPLGAPLPPGARNAVKPTANQIALALGAGRDYPDLETIPAPSKQDLITKDKLHQAQGALQIDKARAARAKEDLLREAGAEPSLLDAYQDGTLALSPYALEADAYVPPPEPPSINVVRGTKSQRVILRDAASGQ
jgi:hypothetical protein